MMQPRRTLRHCLLTVLLDTGLVSPALTRPHHWESPRSIRPLTPDELRELGGPVIRLRFLPGRAAADSRRVGTP